MYKHYLTKLCPHIAAGFALFGLGVGVGFTMQQRQDESPTVFHTYPSINTDPRAGIQENENAFDIEVKILKPVSSIHRGGNAENTKPKIGGR